jgi:hypothetical protein
LRIGGNLLPLFLLFVLYVSVKPIKIKVMTPFEQAQEKVRVGLLKAPSVIVNGKPIDYFGYQIATHHFNLKLMAKGMTFNGIKFTDIKEYYGLKGRSAKDCLTQFEAIVEDYKRKFGLLQGVNKN